VVTTQLWDWVWVWDGGLGIRFGPMHQTDRKHKPESPWHKQAEPAVTQKLHSVGLSLSLASD